MNEVIKYNTLAAPGKLKALIIVSVQNYNTVLLFLIPFKYKELIAFE